MNNRFNVGESDHHHVAGLEIAEGEGEEVLPLHLDERGAPARRLLFAGDFAGARLLLDLGADDAAIDVHFAAIHRRAGGQRKAVEAIHRLRGVLVKDLIDLDTQQIAADVEPALDAFEREGHAGLLQPGDQSEAGGGRCRGLRG